MPASLPWGGARPRTPHSTLHPTFSSQSRSGTENQILTSMPKVPPGMTEDAWNFIASSICKVPTQRPTIHEMLHHSWIEGYRCRRSMRIAPGSPGSPQAAAARHHQQQQQQSTIASSVAAVSPLTPASGVPPSMSLLQQQLHKCESQSKVTNAATVMLAMQQASPAGMNPGTPQRAPPAALFSRAPITGTPGTPSAAAIAVRSRLGLARAPASAAAAAPSPSRDEVAKNLKEFQAEISRKMAAPAPAPALPSSGMQQATADKCLKREEREKSKGRLSAALTSKGHADGSVFMNIGGAVTGAHGGKGVPVTQVVSVDQIHI